MAKPGMMIYFTLTPAIKALPMDHRGMIFTAMLDYAEKQIEPELPADLQFAWAFVKATLDADNERYEAIAEKRRAAAGERWHGDKNAKDALASKSMQVEQVDASDANTNQINTKHSNPNQKIKNKPAKPAEPSVSDIFSEYCGEDLQLREALDEFVAMRKRMKKPLTPSIAMRLTKKLDSFPEGDRKEIVFQSVDNGWQGLFPLKHDENSKKRGESIEYVPGNNKKDSGEGRFTIEYDA